MLWLYALLVIYKRWIICIVWILFVRVLHPIQRSNLNVTYTSHTHTHTHKASLHSESFPARTKKTHPVPLGFLRKPFHQFRVIGRSPPHTYTYRACDLLWIVCVCVCGWRKRLVRTIFRQLRVKKRFRFAFFFLLHTKQSTLRGTVAQSLREASHDSPVIKKKSFHPTGRHSNSNNVRPSGPANCICVCVCLPAAPSALHRFLSQCGEGGSWNLSHKWCLAALSQQKKKRRPEYRSGLHTRVCSSSSMKSMGDE